MAQVIKLGGDPPGQRGGGSGSASSGFDRSKLPVVAIAGAVLVALALLGWQLTRPPAGSAAELQAAAAAASAAPAEGAGADPLSTPAEPGGMPLEPAGGASFDNPDAVPGEAGGAVMPIPQDDPDALPTDPK